MPREEDYPKLKNQPLTLVLAEFRFSPVSDIEAGISELSERFDLDDSNVSEHASQEVHVGSEGVSVKTPNRIWLLRYPDQGRLIQIEKDRLIVITTQYPRFDAFADMCLNSVQALKEIVQPELLWRVGLRYNDAVVPVEDDELSDYLDQRLLPMNLLQDRGAMIEQHRAETMIRTDGGILALRALIGHHGLGVMPDLDNKYTLKLPIDVPSNQQTAVLDFDHFWRSNKNSGEEFTVKQAEIRLQSLHEPAREAFWQVTTEYARRQRWA